MFVHGKHHSFKSEACSALIEAVKMFCDVIALENESTKDNYCALMQDAAGEEGKLLTNIIDNLKNTIGEQAKTPESVVSEVKNRFNYVFIRFIKTIASINSPLTVVLEDIH